MSLPTMWLSQPLPSLSPAPEEPSGESISKIEGLACTARKRPSLTSLLTRPEQSAIAIRRQAETPRSQGSIVAEQAHCQLSVARPPAIDTEAGQLGEICSGARVSRASLQSC